MLRFEEDARVCLLFALACLVVTTGCKKSSRSNAPVDLQNPTSQVGSVDKTASSQGGFARPALLLTQAQFDWVESADGKRKPVPGPAKLLVLTPDGANWRADVVEDASSRVFHKAACWVWGGRPTLLTVAGTQAHLKTWTLDGGRWQGVSHWQPEFGGKWNRLRDFEIGDVTGDDVAEIVIGTHDQGVIAVAETTGNELRPQEIFKRKNTFIHEIEIGDVDGDGRSEIYATVSDPNKANTSQAGGVAVFTGASDGTFRHETVAEYTHRHAKEILVADVDGNGIDELYVSLEARVEKTDKGVLVREPLELVRFTRTEQDWQSATIAALDGGIQARVVMQGDLRGDGARSLVVTTLKDGIWQLTPHDDGSWTKHQIDKQSSGFEHAAALLDLDANGADELYVASDDQGEIRRYVWNGAGFDRETIHRLSAHDLTWSIEGCL